MRFSISILLLIFFLSCGRPKEDKTTTPETFASGLGKAAGQERLIEEVEVADKAVEVAAGSPGRYINRLSKFYNHQDYFVPLYYIDDFSEEAHKTLIESGATPVFEDSETKRLRLDPRIVRKFLQVDQLEELFVFDSNQDLIDTVSINNYEFFDNMIETSFVATFAASLPEGEHVVVSAEGLDAGSLKKSPEVKEDSGYLQFLVSRNGFPLKEVQSFGYFVNGPDTLSYLTTVNYGKALNRVYLLKNGQVVDSLNEEFIITGMTPVPLATKNEILYVASVVIPETDIQWDILTGIDLDAFKFVRYDRNRKY